MKGVARSWTCKMYDKDGYELICSEEDGTIAYVRDAEGNVVWEASKEK